MTETSASAYDYSEPQKAVNVNGSIRYVTTCWHCNGTGYVTKDNGTPLVPSSTRERCHNCSGTGNVLK
jgi:DnaJ-class molecular chaperone